MACVFYLDYDSAEGVIIMNCVSYLDYASARGRDYYELSVLFRLRLRWRANYHGSCV